jgi:hypothetical protein
MKNKIFLFLSMIAGSILMSSCLKDNVGEDWTDSLKGKMYATVTVPTLQSLGLEPAPGEVNFSFLVNIATDELPTEDITVTMKVDPSAITAYNTKKGTNYQLFPNIEILNPTVVIPKGSRLATVNCKVWGAEALNACDNFIAPISIDNVTGGVVIASNMKTYMLSLPIANPYAGDYHVVGYRKHPAPALYPVDKTETASTVNCSTIRKSGMGDYPYDITIEVTQNTIVVSGVTCYKCIVHVIDPATNAPVSSGEGQYDTFTGDATVNPKPETNDVNYYNPVTKTFVLNCYYNSSAPRIAYEVLTRL